MELAFLLVGCLVGFLIAYFFFKTKGLDKESIAKDYVDKSLHQNLEKTKENIEKSLMDERNKVLEISKQNAGLTSEIEHLQKKLSEQKEDLLNYQKKFESEFQVLANKILESKSEKFVNINQEHLGRIIDPLKERIQAFEKQVSDVYQKESREKVALQTELKQLLEMNHQMSLETNKLTQALKGDSKVQGDWGEMQLESILEHAGLTKNIHFTAQDSFTTEDGKQLRTDYIIQLPENKSVILDSKVSLTAYERYFNAETPEDRQKHLKDHVKSLQSHIAGLSSKNYQNLDINSPDYVLLFVPLEAALHVALQENPKLFEQAMRSNIVLVSTSTLLATLRTVSFLWNQENQQRNAKEIAKQAGALYDKFVGFTEDLKKVRKKIGEANNACDDAFNKLTESPKKGDTVIGRIENLKSLGAASTKALPDDVLNLVQ